MLRNASAQEAWYHHVMEAAPDLGAFREEKDVEKHIAELESTFTLSADLAI